MRPSLVMANGLFVASALVWLLAAIVAFSQPFRAAPIPVFAQRLGTQAMVAELNRGWYGFVLRLDGDRDVMQFKQAIDEIAAMNANGVLLETPLFAQGPEAVVLTGEGAHGPSLTDMVSIIDYANERGLGVVLVPTVVFAQVSAGQSRSQFAPADWERWWLSYERQMLRLADLAEASKVEIFAVGSELGESEIMTSRWINLLAQARVRYSGLLMYNAQLERAARVAFWDHVDVIGVSAWLPPVESEDASPTNLESPWEQALHEIDLLAAGHERPVLLTAVGYPRLFTAAGPSREAAPGRESIGEEKLQAASLSDFLTRFEAVDSRKSHRVGFFVYRWEPSDEALADSNEASADSKSLVIEVRQAQGIVRDAFGRLAARREPP